MVVMCEMGRMLRPLTRADWPGLHRLMRERQFPRVPERFEDCLASLEPCRILGVEDTVAGGLWAAFLFGPPDDGIAFFDAVCARRAEGLWASPRVLKGLFSYAFGEMGLRAVWVEPLKGKPLRAALSAGFVPVTPWEAPEPVLVLTPNMVPRRLRDFEM